MGDIKFRGFSKNLTNNKWVYGDLVNYSETEKIIVEQNSKTWDLLECGIIIDEKSIDQFTGLHDKNGKEIFEGDKLRDDYYDEDTVIEDYAVVVWDGKLCQWAIDNSFAQDGSSYTNLVEYFGRENLEIIGNVFENADLVKL